MKKWLRRIAGAVLTGMSWAAAWAPVGVLAGMVVDPDGSMDEMWVAIGAYPGFLCGVVFSAGIGIAEGRRRIDEVSLPRSGALGAASGLLVGVLPFALATPNPELPAWARVVIIGSITLLAAVSAVGSMLLLRYLAREQPPAVAGPTG